MTTPKENGFFMPSEWHPHTATWIAWPGLEEAYMVTTTRDKNHPDYEVLKANLETLKNSTDAKARKLEIIEIDQPAEYIYTCPMNFYFVNGAVIIPAYGFPEYDQYVLDVFKKTFTDLEVIQLNTGVILFGGGNIHCITQQQPAPWNFNS